MSYVMEPEVAKSPVVYGCPSALGIDRRIGSKVVEAHIVLQVDITILIPNPATSRLHEKRKAK